MPLRQRRARRRKLSLTPQIYISLDIGPVTEDLRPYYDEHRERVMGLHTAMSPETRPAGWWAWETGVPDELRGTDIPHLVPVSLADQHREALDELERGRREWLAGR